MDEYRAATGHGDFYPLHGTLEVGRLARFLAGPGSPLHSFDFVDRQTGKQILPPDFEILEAIAYEKWEANSKEQLVGIVYTVDAIIGELTKAYAITPQDRRSGDRRSGDRRS
jgi:hypothetical protein